MNATPETIDQAHERLGHTAPRVTPADLEANIVRTEIVTFKTYGGQVLRWAVLTCRNGFAITGDPSASVDPANDSRELGERFAIENARRALWPMMGYALKSTLAPPHPTAPCEFVAMTYAEHHALGHEHDHARAEWVVPK